MTSVAWLLVCAAAWFQALPATPPPTDADRTAARYAEEDRAHAAIEDRIARLEARLDAANRAYRLDLPTRDRTRFWWTPYDERTRRAALATAQRMGTLANATTADLLGDDSNSAPRLRDRSALIAAIGRQVLEHAESPKTPIDERLKTLHRTFGDAPAKLSRLDGPTLALMAAAAGSVGETTTARTLLERAARNPLGLDAVEIEFLRQCINDGGLDSRRRAENAIRMLDERMPPGDRMLLASILMQARLDAGRPLGAVAGEVRRRLLPENGIESTVRVALLRTLADLIDAQSQDITEIADLHPLAALSRADRIANRDTDADADAAMIEALLTRAADSPVPAIKAEGLLELAVRSADAGENETASARLAAMAEALPSHPQASKAASLAVRLAAYDDLAATVERLVSAIPDHPERHRWLLELGIRAERNGDTTFARSTWLEIPNGAPERVEAVLLATRLDLDTQRRETWAEDLMLLDALEPPEGATEASIDRDLLRIELLLGMGRTADAERAAIDLIERPDLPVDQIVPVAAIVSEALEATQRSEDAITFVLRLADTHPSVARPLVAGIMERAVERVVRALDADRPSDARNLATTVLARGWTDVETFTRSEDATTSALVGAAWLLATVGREKEAATLVDLALEREPDGLEPLFLRAVLRGGRLRDRREISEEDARLALADLARIAAGTSRGSIWWWRAEVERLELLVALDLDLERVGDRIERWRRQFPSLGGSDFARRLRRLERVIANQDRPDTD